MTPSAIKVLNEVSLILAEDTRTSAVLMKHFNIATPMRSHHKFNEHETTAGIIQMLEAGALLLKLCLAPLHLCQPLSIQDFLVSDLPSRDSCLLRKGVPRVWPNSVLSHAQ